MNWSIFVSGVALMLNALVIGFWKPWLGAYGGEKGKNLARKEDLDAILAEVRAVTITQKEIETKLSGDLWNLQMRRNEKKELYGQLLATIHEMLSANSMMRAVVNIDRGRISQEEATKLDQRLNAALMEFTKSERELIRLSGQAAIFASQECATLLTTTLNIPRGDDFLSGSQLLLSFRRLADMNSRMIAFAKTDLGITT